MFYLEKAHTQYNIAYTMQRCNVQQFIKKLGVHPVYVCLPKT